MAFEAGAEERSGGSSPGSCSGPQGLPGGSCRQGGLGCVLGSRGAFAVSRLCPGALLEQRLPPRRWGMLPCAEGKAVTPRVPGCKNKSFSRPGELLWGSHSREEGEKNTEKTPEEKVFETDLKNVSLFWITFSAVKPGGGTSQVPGSEGRAVDQG